MVIVFFLFSFVISFVSSQTPTLVFVGFRHANRNPASFLPNDPNKGSWGWEGEAQLTDVGKKQAYALGKLLRKIYGSFISEQWNASEIDAISSSADRCQHTVQLVLAGLYPPTGWSKWSPELQWQPTSVKIDDQVLRTYATKCPQSDQAWKPVNDGTIEPGKSLLEKHKDLIAFVSSKTGWAPTLSKMADVADNLEQLHSQQLMLPGWIFINSFGKMLYDEIVKFAEIPQITCANYPPCRKMMAGFWLNNVLNEIDQNYQNAKYTKKIFLYGTHNEIGSSFLQLLGVKQDGLPYNGAFFLEYTNSPTRLVRLYYSVPKNSDPSERETKLVKLCSGGEWCPYQLLNNNTELIADWKLACGIDGC